MTVDDIIARFGPRRPAAGSAPASLRVATILVTRDGLSTPEEMWLYTYFAGRGERRDRVPVQSGFMKELGRPFYLATGGLRSACRSSRVAPISGWSRHRRCTPWRQRTGFGPHRPGPPMTAAGTYQITVNGTAGNMIRNTTVTLVVQ